MKAERKCVQSVDLSGSMEFFDRKLSLDRSKYFAVEIEILASQIEVFHILIGLFLLTHVVSKASWLTASGAV